MCDVFQGCIRFELIGRLRMPATAWANHADVYVTEPLINRLDQRTAPIRAENVCLDGSGGSALILDVLN
jgi:hypothetical protein